MLGIQYGKPLPFTFTLTTCLVCCQVSQFLQTLEQDLRLGVGGRLDSVLGQCMYFGLSFSRVGADFRGLLAPIFERAALAGFTTAVNDANTRFMLILVLDDGHLFNGLFSGTTWVGWHQKG